MAVCETCGNDYDKAFQVRTSKGESHTFDSFECAIQMLAPTCAHCGEEVKPTSLRPRPGPGATKHQRERGLRLAERRQEEAAKTKSG